MIRVYTASKLQVAAQWLELDSTWTHVYFHARWLKHQKIGTLDTPEFAKRFWQEDQEDVKNADALLVYGREGDKLRGALVEVGMALAYGVPVIVVGEHSDYGTWQYHAGATRVKDLEAAGRHLEILGNW